MPRSSLQHGGRVGADDLLPQSGIAAGDPGDVAQTLPGEQQVALRDA